MKTISVVVPAATLLVLSVAAGEVANAVQLNATSVSSSRAIASESRSSVEALCSGAAVGLDLPGYDLRSVSSSDHSPCSSYCYSDGSCQAWTWTDFNGGTCWLKSGHGNAVFRAGAVSGANFQCVDGSARYLVVENCDARGNDVTSLPGASYWDCMNFDYVSFTWSDYGGGTCWYKSTASGCDYAANKFTGVRLRGGV